MIQAVLTFQPSQRPITNLPTSTFEKKWRVIFSDPEKIGQLLADSIFEAHQRTCLLSREQIQAGCSQGINDFKVEQFKKMVSIQYSRQWEGIWLCSFQPCEDLWICSAQRLTNVIQQIIEFAKMVPGFMQFQQEDQIVLLKAGKFPGAGIKTHNSKTIFSCRKFWTCSDPTEPLLWSVQ